MVRGFLNNYFGFNRQQRNGLLALMSVSLLLVFLRLTYPLLMDKSEIGIRYIPVVPADTSLQDTLRLFVFDPNTAHHPELLNLGFPPKTAETLIKYRKNHRIEKKEDLLKVYGVTQKLYDRLENYIVIAPATPRFRENSGVQAQKKESQARIELNSADSANLVAVPGIGPVFARRIIKYRSLLGGYNDIGQLREVYGIDAGIYEKIARYLYVDRNTVKKIDLNTDDFKSINRHPYISYELTRSFFNARRGSRLDSSSLRQLMADDSLYRKLLPYVTF